MDASTPGRGRVTKFSKFSEMVADDLRGKVARGEVRPGDHLPSETELMDIYGVARPTMREALRILESESLISLRRGSHRGPLVQVPDIGVLARRTGLRLQMQGTSINDLVEARAVMEPGVVALAAKRRTGSDLQEMRDCLKIAGDSRNVLDFVRRAAEFHVLVVRSSHNRTMMLLVQLVSSLLQHQYESVLRNVSEDEGREFIEQSIARYEHLTELIENRDAEGAADFWAAHGTVGGEFWATSRSLGPRLELYS
ncbi:FCD domain-containing protein [Frankia sp. Cppng1_Ct_nod]|uniref:FadR/GntR family transcriptional regulator n=1 Tax=Frankia sp. Cppng1_Ct_nod TaxID=2897162 RepID=UPI0010413043|nr:FCD domain-containing protein [Frankia sp. Cppng1_Ct_nod]